jgi:polysaccharide export outer membrane protein
LKIAPRTPEKLEVTQMLKMKIFPSFIFLFTLFLTIFLSNKGSSAETESPHYLIGPDDILNIFVWREPELTRDVTVMPDGRITFPLTGDIMAQGRTVAELKENITAKLKKYIDSPEVTVIVNESRSLRIYTIGNLRRPGPYRLEVNMTVLQALSTAGGFAEWADTKNILIVRRQGGKEIQLLFNYKEFISGKNVEQNIVLHPNDTIVVP